MLNLGVSFPAVRSLTLLSLADPPAVGRVDGLDVGSAA
jgi:hypothetical protein